MRYIKTPIEGLVEIEPQIFGDERGYFFESFRSDKFKKKVADVEFVQDNQSFSGPGVLRGLHFQVGDHAQGKLVRVVSGKVLDVAVDLRPDSATFGQWHSVLLDSERQNMFYVPPGFGHGIHVLTESIFLYKCTQYYNKDAERSICWNDGDLAIDWQIENPQLSDKDFQGMSFREYKETLV